MSLLPVHGQQPAPSWPRSRSWFTHVAFAPDSTLLTGWDVTPRLWVREVPSGRLLWSARVNRTGRRVAALAVAADAGLLVTAALTGDYSSPGTLGARILLWRLGTGERLGTIELDRDGEVHHLCVSPDGSRVFVLRSACAEIWDPRSSTRIFRRELPPYFEGRWYTAAQTPDGRHVILSGKLDGPDGGHTVEVRRTADGELAAHANLGSSSHRYSDLVVSPDSRLLLLAALYDGSHQVRAWHLPSGRPAGSLPGGAGQYQHLAFLADHSVVAMASRDDGQALLLWQADPVLSGRIAVSGCSRAEAARLRALTADGPDEAWDDLLDALVSWQHRHDISLAGQAPAPENSDIELD